MADGYRVIQGEDGTFHVELWSAKGGREQLIYKRAFPTRELAQAWTVPVEVPFNDPARPSSREFMRSPRRLRAVKTSAPSPLPLLVSPPVLPGF